MFELAPRLRHNLRNRTAFNEKTVTLACPICTHAVTFVPKATSATCERCLTPLLRGPDDDQPLAPTAILPLAVTEDAADARLRAAFPQARDPAYVLAWTRVYVPYWRFSVHVTCPWSHEARSYDASAEDYYVERSSGEIEDDFTFAFPAARLENVSGLLEELKPTALDEALPFEPALLGGIPVQPVTTGLEHAWERARTRVDERVEEALKDAAGLWSGLPEQWVINRTREQAALVLVPLYVGVGRKDGSTDTFVLDGSSGIAMAGTPRAAAAARPQPSGEGGGKNDMTLGVALLVLGGLAAIAGLLLWGAVALGQALLAMLR